MAKLLSSVLHYSCSHEFSWPRRLSNGNHYQVCLRCGDQFAYDWESMSRGERISVEGTEQITTSPEPRRYAWVPRARRIRTNGPILYRPSGTTEWQAGTMGNISQSGVSIESNQLLPDNTDVEMIFEMVQEISGQPNSRVFCRGYVTRSGFTRSGRVVLAAAISGYTFLDEG